VQIDLNEKRYDLALAHAQQAIKIEPNNPQPPYVAAVTYAQMGDLQSAKTILNQMLISYPDFSQTSMALEQIKKMEIGNTKN
jgi:predicted Zn-dependent protease